MQEVSGSQDGDDAPVFTRLKAALGAANTRFELMHHAPVYTSAEAAAVRGTSLRSGAKALIVKGDAGFSLAVMPADRSLDSRAFRRLIGSRGLRFASAEEVLELTGLRPGSIPPFGSLFGLQTVCDLGLSENPSINFNAGSHCDSIQMKYADYAAFEKPTLAAIAK